MIGSRSIGVWCQTVTMARRKTEAEEKAAAALEQLQTDRMRDSVTDLAAKSGEADKARRDLDRQVDRLADQAADRINELLDRDAEVRAPVEQAEAAATKAGWTKTQLRQAGIANYPAWTHKDMRDRIANACKAKTAPATATNGARPPSAEPQRGGDHNEGAAARSTTSS